MKKHGGIHRQFHVFDNMHKLYLLFVFCTNVHNDVDVENLGHGWD